MTAQSRFVTLEHVVDNVRAVMKQTSEEAMILKSGLGRLVAAIIVGSDMTEIRQVADELRSIGESPGLGNTPYFLMQSDLHAAMRHLRCTLNNGSAVIVGVEDEDRLTYLSFIPLLPGIESSLLREAINSGSITISTDGSKPLSSKEVAKEIGLPTH